MTGKTYTMREMKTIVEYLTEHKAYSNIRGRKMWMDFANSKVTNRTWQSLKETFMKRILPDIQNPYYKLTMDQIHSFRQGYDIVARDKNKLEIVSVSEDSNNSVDHQNNVDQSKTNNTNEEQIITGEVTTSAKITSRNRSSADTLILEKCYDTAEDIQRDLESPGTDNQTTNDKRSTKSIRDCITYSEPLTPMLQEVLHDFVSESENSDELKIDENISEKENKDGEQSSTDIGNNEPSVITINDSEDVLVDEKCSNETSKKNFEDVVTVSSSVDTDANAASESQDVCVKPNNDTNCLEKSKSKNLTNNDDKKLSAKLTPTNTTTVSKLSQNYSNSTFDSILPNNQEELGNKLNGKGNVLSNDSKKPARKRSSSQNLPSPLQDAKKQKEDSQVEVLNKSRTEVNEDTTTGAKDLGQNLEKSKVDKNVESNQKSFNKDAKASSPQNIEINGLSNTRNPCLNSVNLFAEQFNTTRYSDSDSSVIDTSPMTSKDNSKSTNDPKSRIFEDVNTKPVHNSNIITTTKEVVLLHSHSESENEVVADDTAPQPRAKYSKISSKLKKDRALANLFGFSSGGVTSSRMGKSNYRKRSHSHRYSLDNELSGSSEWTSEEDSEMYVSPPRGRKNKQTRKYLKPQSSRVLSLDEEGGLFVLHGKKIYPLVKDGRIIKNYLTYLADSDSEEDESYWKQKYKAEKKKSEQLHENIQKHQKEIDRNTSRNSKSVGNEHVPAPLVPTDVKPETVKIRFMKNNEELHLEGHWPQIHPLLEQAVNIFHKKPNDQVDAKTAELLEPQTGAGVVKERGSSGMSSPVIIAPVDSETHEKIEKIEEEIFKEIEEKDKQQELLPEIETETNVTKRKIGRPRKAIPSPTSRKSSVESSKQSTSEASSSKRAKLLVDEKITEKIVVSTRKPKSSITDSNTPKRQTRNSRAKLSEPPIGEDIKTIKSKTKDLPTEIAQEKEDVQVEINSNIRDNIDAQIVKVEGDVQTQDDDGMRYMFPSKKPKGKTHSGKTKKQKPIRSTNVTAKPIAPLYDLSMNSIESTQNSVDSTQGYQDSDNSPVNVNFLRKRKFSMSSAIYNINKYRNTRRKSHPYLCRDTSSDSSNSSFNGKLLIREDNSLKSNVYNSESYQLLFPKIKYPFGQFRRIVETKISKDVLENINEEQIADPNHLNVEVGSSSNISLPLSPELSIVENLSISNDILNNIEYHATINEIQANYVDNQETCDKYFISEVDASVPLMDQECGLQQSFKKDLSNHTTTNSKPVVSQSLLNKICAVNIEDSTISNSLDQRLRELLLESAKKLSQTSEDIQNNNDMDVDIQLLPEKKTQTRKRCSTPRKKKDTKKLKALAVEPVIEEEHTETYSSGRKSCPPLLNVFSDCEINAQYPIGKCLNVVQSKNSLSSKATKKKDVIKVKIQRPKDKKSSDKLIGLSTQFVNDDSGINETESGISCRYIDDTIDLIHNHSETCLQANECLGDSVQLIETPAKSVISLSTNSIQSCDVESLLQFEDTENIPPEMYCNDAQQALQLYNETPDTKNLQNNSEQLNTSVMPELLNSSLLTEDLSDEPANEVSSIGLKVSKWYLLSEDETNTVGNTVNRHTGPESNLNFSTFGSNLKQIFPITCAVPDLSTVSETSRENDDNSRKCTA